MILDSSAILAILFREPERGPLLLKLDPPVPRSIGAPTLVETATVLARRLGWESLEGLERFLREMAGTVLPFEEIHWVEAIEAHRKFGKGRHPAALNFGDCLSYAVARVAGEPLLCTGNDFTRTDLDLA